MVIEFFKSKFGWIDILREHDQIGTIFIKQDGAYFEPQTNSEEYSCIELEQIVAKMKELQEIEK